MSKTNEELRREAERLARQAQEARMGMDPMTAGAMKGTLAGQPQRFTTGAMEPTTPPAPHTTAPMQATGYTMGVASPGTATRGGTTGSTGIESTRVTQETRTQPRGGRVEEEETEYHQPYSRDIHHGEHMFPKVKGHETEEFEQCEGYASPDDINPEIKKRVEQHEKQGWTEEEMHHTHAQGRHQTQAMAGRAMETAEGQAEAATAKAQETARTAAEKASNVASQAGEQASGAARTAAEKASNVASQAGEQASGAATEAKHQAEGMVEQAKEAVRHAVRVTAERLSGMILAGKEAVGIPRDKPLTTAAKEAVGIAPEKPIGEAAREATASVREVAGQKATNAAQRVREVTVEALQTVKMTAAQFMVRVIDFLKSQVPAHVKGYYQEGQRLAEEKDRTYKPQQMVQVGGGSPGAAGEHHPSYAPHYRLPIPMDQVDQTGHGGWEKIQSEEGGSGQMHGAQRQGGGSSGEGQQMRGGHQGAGQQPQQGMTSGGGIDESVRQSFVGSGGRQEESRGMAGRGREIGKEERVDESGRYTL